MHFTYHSFSLLTVPSFIHEHATAILAANYCYNIIDLISMHFISFHLKKTNERAIESINPCSHYTHSNSTTQFIQLIEMNGVEWMRSLSFIHSFSLHSLKWNWMRETKSWMNVFTAHSISFHSIPFVGQAAATQYNLTPFQLNEMRVDWLKAAPLHFVH